MILFFKEDNHKFKKKTNKFFYTHIYANLWNCNDKKPNICLFFLIFFQFYEFASDSLPLRYLEVQLWIKSKVILHSIRFSSVFVRFFLRFCFSVKKFALFYPRFISPFSH